MRWEWEWKLYKKVDSIWFVYRFCLQTLPGLTQGSCMKSCSQTNIGGGRQLRLGGGEMTTTMQQLRGLEAYPQKLFSELRLSIVYTVLDSLGIHKLEGINQPCSWYARP